MADAAAGPSAPSGRHQRSVRNYLLDSRFQLKYAGYFVGITLVLSVLLGGLLWSAGGKVIAQSQETVEQGKLVVELGGQVLTVDRGAGSYENFSRLFVERDRHPLRQESQEP